VNAEQWNAMYPVGTLVFAYPGCRPEDDRNAPRLVTRTRTKAQMSASGDPVVWVDGEGSYICLTHVDPVSESVWQAARKSDVCGAREPEPRTGTSPCVLPAGHGGLKHQDKWTNQWPALPVPVGDQPRPLDDTRLTKALAAYESHPDLGFACCSAHAVADHVPALLAEVERLKAELAQAREDAAFLERNTLPELRRTVEHHQAGKQRWRGRAQKAEARVAELEAERHTTNEALDDAVQALRESHAAPTTTPEEAS
jgi:hypothetical protein